MHMGSMEGDNKMSKEDWIANLGNVSSSVASNLGSEAVDFVFAKYGATNIEDLSESHYSEVFSELYLMSQDY